MSPLTPTPVFGRERLGEAGRAKSAVAFADDEFRRGEPLVGREPFADDHAEGVDVAADRPEFLARLVSRGDDLAVAGARGVDEDEIGEIEPGLRIVDERRRCGRVDRRAAHRQPPRPERAEIEPRGGGARPAVEYERHRTSLRICARQHIADIGDIGLLRAVLVAELDRARRRLEVERSIRQRERMFGDRIRRQLPRRVGGGMRRRRWRARRGMRVLRVSGQSKRGNPQADRESSRGAAPQRHFLVPVVTQCACRPRSRT